MALSTWVNVITDRRLDVDELQQLRDRAHRLYEANGHIFEDECEALCALGAEPMLRHLESGGAARSAL